MDLSFLNDDALSDKLKKYKLDEMKQDYLTKLNRIHTHWKKLNEKLFEYC